MLVTSTKLINTPIMSMQTGAPLGFISAPVIDPDSLKIIAFLLTGPTLTNANILDVKSIREYSSLGMIIDGVEELAAPGDVVKIDKILDLNFHLIDLKVETKKGSKLGKVTDYTLTIEDYMIQQLIVKRPPLKALIDPELVISRKEIVEVTDDKIIVKDEEKVIKKRAEKEDFIPNFVNPFREKQPGFAPADIKNSKH
ncbi:PRC-barrel domain-containing protein [Candidatus Saccharibacteria bacterium]|nr:PRC-barrel domain-containing protein [Candidatus Saccharibacteria bacterium]